MALPTITEQPNETPEVRKAREQYQKAMYDYFTASPAFSIGLDQYMAPFLDKYQLAISGNETNDAFQKILGRESTKEEKEYFGKFLKDGELQGYEIEQILKSTPEYQKRLQKEQFEEIQGQLGQYDTQLLQQAQGQLTSQYRQMGRPFTSAYDNAFAQAAQQLAMNRQPFLTQYLSGGQGDLRSQYLGAGQQAIGRGYGLRDETRQRGYALEDYYRQQNYYNNLMNQQNRFQRNQFLGGGIGSLIGAGIGGYFGGVPGAQVGSQAGGLFGTGAGSLF